MFGLIRLTILLRYFKRFRKRLKKTTIITFNYPVKLTQQKEGGYLIQFINLPEAISQVEDKVQALQEAVNCLKEAIANRIAMKLDAPNPSPPKKRQHTISLSMTLAAKTALYIAMRNEKISNVAMAKKLQCDEKEVRRLLDLYYHSKLPNIENALHILGRRLDLSVGLL